MPRCGLVVVTSPFHRGDIVSGLSLTDFGVIKLRKTLHWVRASATSSRQAKPGLMPSSYQILNPAFFSQTNSEYTAEELLCE